MLILLLFLVSQQSVVDFIKSRLSSSLRLVGNKHKRFKEGPPDYTAVCVIINCGWNNKKVRKAKIIIGEGLK